MSRPDTRERILDTAERLFADRGISGTSLRALTRAAGVNLASVHYYFGSKDALLSAVVERRAVPVNEERVRLLDALEVGGATPGVEAIWSAYVAPMLTAVPIGSAEGQRLARLIARIEAQPPKTVEALSRQYFGDVARRFVDALSRALPELSERLVASRFRFAVGLLAFVFSGNYDLDSIPGHPPPQQAPEARVAGAIRFIAAGMLAAAPVVDGSYPEARSEVTS